MRLIALLAAGLATLMPVVALASPAAASSSTNSLVGAALVFTPTPSAGPADQDRLAAAIQQATTEGRELVVAPGTVTLTRTLTLPHGARLRLGGDVVLTGAIPGQALVRLAGGSSVAGGTVHNTATLDCLDVDVAAGSRHATISGTTFRGARANAVYVNAADVQDLTVQNSRFIGTAYGVLVNPLAVRARDITITSNRFTGITGDAIELNTPVQQPRDAVQGVTIAGNVVSDMRGQGNSSGFAIGIAGVVGYRIEGNRIVRPRSEAVHLEAGARDGVVRRNLIRGGGVGGRPAIAVYRTVAGLLVERNVVEHFDGAGIAVLWDAIGSSKDVTTVRNLIRDVTGDGIVMGGDAGTGPFIVSRNAVIRAQDGIVSFGIHAQDVVRSNLVRLPRGRPVVSAYQGASVRTVTGNRTGFQAKIASVVGDDVIVLGRMSPEASRTPTRP